MNTLEQKHKIIAGTQLICMFFLILFWVGYYLLPLIWENTPAFYNNYPGAFPLPDLITGGILASSAIMILLKRKTSHWISYLSGFVLLILGVIGFQLPIDENTILISMVTMMKSGFINLWCVVSGLYTLLKLREKEKTESK